MPYNVQFVGLSWFNEDPQGTVRVLLPDGRNFKKVPRHDFSICVAASTVKSSSGWELNEVKKDDFSQLMQFLPPPSKVVLEGTDSGGHLLDTTDQLPCLPILRAFDRSVLRVDPDQAVKVGDFEIQQGTFKAFRFPNRDPREAAIVTTLEVEHDDAITITLTALPDPASQSTEPLPTSVTAPGRGVTSKLAAGVRTITLEPGTEIAIVNASRGIAIKIGNENHDDIYQQLSGGIPVKLIPPETPAEQVKELTSHHPIFQVPTPIFSGPGCSNVKTG